MCVCVWSINFFVTYLMRCVCVGGGGGEEEGFEKKKHLVKLLGVKL